MTPPEPRTAAGWSVERKARELAGSNHVHGAIPARFWRAAIEAEASRIDVPPETEAVRRCVTHHACACHERLAEIGRRYIKAYEAEP
jgi:hypothetical protein